LVSRYGLGTDAEKMTLEAIGKRYGITRERVRQIENAALSIIRKGESFKNEKEIFYDTFIDSEKIALLKKDIKDYDELVKSGNWINRECHFKSYGKSNAECEYCKKAKIYK
jgi:pSer/pThr/pTyr-binding forkhead associated (FHA) protein